METSCGFYILNKNNELLIIHPSLGKGKGSWGIPKGKMEVGETKLETAFRELKEETNLTINDFTYIKHLPDSKYKYREKMLHSFLLKTDEFDSNTPIECVSYVKTGHMRVPENDKHMWIDVNDNKLESLLHEAQVSNLLLIREIINKVKL